MNELNLAHIAQSLYIGRKGLLAIDESITTCNKRFATQGIAQTVEIRRACHHMLISTLSLGQHISGAILCNDIIRQHTAADIVFTELLVGCDIASGITVDTGITYLPVRPEDRITEGL